MRAQTKVATGLGVVFASALITAAVFRSKHPAGNSAVPEPKKSVSVDRYVGRWYEIARYEQRFERGCTDVTADYKLRSDGKLNVVNTCRRSDGAVRVARGTARIVSASGAKLRVQFFRPFSGDYWVLDHADDYSWSIVGEPSGRYLWILARQSKPESATVTDLIARVAAMGYDTSMLLMTPQT